jgi:DNA repair protein RecO (recombination protein O)
MSKNTLDKDLKTFGYVLRRTNYGEADKILNIITPSGKITAIAKGARKSKSKLAGGVELFSLTDFVIHRGKSEFGIVTSAKMLKYYGEILSDFGKMELAGAILKKINQVAENSDSAEYFDIVDQCLRNLNNGTNLVLVESWFLLNVAKALGEEMNLHRDESGQKLKEDTRYDFDSIQGAFVEKLSGEFGANEIKMLRFMTTAELDVVKRVKVEDELLRRNLALIKVATRQ